MRIVAPGRFGTVIYCDDVRTEVGNKLSYMGIYKGDLVSSEPYPYNIQKVFAVVHYYEPATDPALDLNILIYLPGVEDDKAPSMQIDIPAPPDAMAIVQKDLSLSDQARALVLPVLISPLIVTKPGRLRVRLRRGDEIYRLTSLAIGEPEAAA